MTELRPDDIVILVMGQTGTGKSTFINSVAGNADAYVGDDLKSGTTSVQEFEIPKHFHNHDRRVVLVDTPGTGAADMRDSEVLRMIVDWLVDTFKKGIRITGILFVQRMNAFPFTREHAQEVAVLRQMCGSAFIPHIAIVTTMANRVGEKRWIRELCESELYWKPLLDGGATCLPFDDRGSVYVILDYFRRKSPQPLRIQREMMRYGEQIKCSSAWYIMEEETSQEALQGKGKRHMSRGVWKFRRWVHGLGQETEDDKATYSGSDTPPHRLNRRRSGGEERWSMVEDETGNPDFPSPDRRRSLAVHGSSRPRGILLV